MQVGEWFDDDAGDSDVVEQDRLIAIGNLFEAQDGAGARGDEFDGSVLVGGCAAGWGDGEFTDGGVHGDAQSGGVIIAGVMAPGDGVFFSGDKAAQVLFDVAEALEAHDVILFGD